MVAASPNWHFSTVVIYTSIPTVDHLIDLAGIKETVISFGQSRQIRGLGIELGALRTGTFGISAMASCTIE